MRPRALPPATLAAALLGASLAAACDRSDPPAGADSALARDLTLANGTARPPLSDSLTLGGDTAAARPSAAIAPPPAAPVAAPAPSRTAPPAPARVPSTTARSSAARSSAAPRQTVAVRRAPAPSSAPAGPARRPV